MRTIRHVQAALDLLIRRLENGPAGSVPPCARTALNSLHRLSDPAGPMAVSQFGQIENDLHVLGTGAGVEELGGFLQRLRRFSSELNQRTSQRPSYEEALRLRLTNRSDGEKISDERLRELHLIEEGDIFDVFNNVTEFLRFNIDLAVKRSLLEYWFFPRRDIRNIAVC